MVSNSNYGWNGNKAVAVTGPDPFQAFADATAPRTIIGKILKFSKGEYSAGEHGDVIPIGTKFVPAMDEALVGWVRWEDSRPVEHLMGRIADGHIPPPRRSLGDQDAAAWVPDVAGNTMDPWQESAYLVMRREDSGDLYTFIATSRGSRGAIADLARQYARMRKKHPDKWPLVTLQWGEYEHKVKSYGKIKFPIFTVVGEAPMYGFDGAPLEDGTPQMPFDPADLPDDVEEVKGLFPAGKK